MVSFRPSAFMNKSLRAGGNVPEWLQEDPVPMMVSDNTVKSLRCLLGTFSFILLCHFLLSMAFAALCFRNLCLLLLPPIHFFVFISESSGKTLCPLLCIAIKSRDWRARLSVFKSQIYHFQCCSVVFITYPLFASVSLCVKWNNSSFYV